MIANLVGGLIWLYPIYMRCDTSLLTVLRIETPFCFVFAVHRKLISIFFANLSCCNFVVRTDCHSIIPFRSFLFEILINELFKVPYTNWSISCKVNKITRMKKKRTKYLVSKLKKKGTKNLYFYLNISLNWDGLQRGEDSGSSSSP